MKSPAAASTTSDTATWPTTSASRSPNRRVPDDVERSARSALAASSRVARNAGSSAESTTVAPVTASVKRRMRPSRGNSSATGTGNGGRKALSASAAQRASATPAVPPRMASTNPSVSSCRIRRARPPPSASRTASSRRRTLALANSRFARLAQQTRRTRPATPIRSPRNWVTGPRMLGKIRASRSGRTVTRRCFPATSVHCSGYARWSRAATTAS